MCKQDVQIGRRLDYVALQVSVSASGTQAGVLPRRPSRIGVILCGQWGGLAPPEGVQLFRNENGNIVYVGAISPDHPYLYLSVKDLGDVLLGAFDLQNSGGNAFNGTVTDVFLTVSLEDI